LCLCRAQFNIIRMSPPLDALIIGPTQASAAVIWLHGLGADGHDFEPIVAELQFGAKAVTRFVFPHAPLRPVTLNGGYVMRAWYDIYGLEQGARQDEAGLRQAAVALERLLAKQLDHGIDSRRIVVAGFSQGGAVALHTGLRYPQPLAGILALSTYLPLADTLAAELNIANQHTPIFMAHGRDDNVIALSFAEHSRAVLSRQGCQVDWHTYAMPHSVTPKEIDDISQWLATVLR
jgi:phospholipase/carboxylesterase